MSRPRVLFVSSVQPFVFYGGGNLRVHHFLKMLSRLAEVTCIAILPKEERGKGDTALAGHMGISYEEWELLDPHPASSFLRLRPTEMGSYYSPAYAERLRSVVRNRAIECVWLDHMFFADYAGMLSQEGVPVVFDAHNVESHVYRDKSSVSRICSGKVKYLLKWLLVHRLESVALKDASFLVTSSEPDAEYYARRCPHLAVRCLHNTINLDYYVDTAVEPVVPRRRPALLFTGLLKYEPTFEAVLFFHREIMPLLDRLLPGYVFYVVGKDPVEDVCDLAGENVVVTGYVESTLPYFRAADVFVVPLRKGSGTRLKIMEAMAAGVPVVTTPKGCEGMSVEHGKHALIAATPEDFANSIVRVILDTALRTSLIGHGRELVRELYDWRTLEQPMRSLLGTILASRRRAP